MNVENDRSNAVDRANVVTLPPTIRERVGKQDIVCHAGKPRGGAGGQR